MENREKENCKKLTIPEDKEWIKEIQVDLNLSIHSKIEKVYLKEESKEFETKGAWFLRLIKKIGSVFTIAGLIQKVIDLIKDKFLPG